MRAVLGMLGDRLRNNFWFLPGLMCLLAVVFAFATLALDRTHSLDGVGQGWFPRLLFTGGPPGARQVLSVIAQTSMTVAGVVFSITMVALTLASQQYGSRLLANFTRDRGNQFTLGVFLATFLYSLLILRSIHSGGHRDVPHLSVTVALVMAVGGVSVLIFFVHHMAANIQSSNLTALIAGEFRSTLDRAYPADAETGSTAVPVLDDADAAEVPAGQRGYLQLVDYEGLAGLAKEHDLEIRVEHRPGSFVVPSSVIVRAWPAERVDDALAGRIARHVSSGSRRTPQQDVEFPARQLAEIAVRALSTGINDVVTATMCVDHLSDGLCEAAGRPLLRSVVRDGDGRVRTWSNDPVTFADLIGAYDGIRECAAYHSAVYVHALEALTRVAHCVRDRERLEPVRRQARLFLEAAERGVDAEADREPIRRRYDDFRALAGED